jgi:hypothetical protein
MRLLLGIVIVLASSCSAHAQMTKWTCYAIGAATITSGTGYTPGLYRNIALTGGAGANAVADVLVDDTGKVVDVTIRNPGHDFKLNDVLTGTISSHGSGFSLLVKQVHSFHSDHTPGLAGIKTRGPPPCNRSPSIADVQFLLQSPLGSETRRTEVEAAGRLCHSFGAERTPLDAGQVRETGKWLPGWEACAAIDAEANSNLQR